MFDRCEAVDELLTYDDLAVLLKAPRSFAEGLVRRGDVPHVRLGGRYVRVRTVDVQAYLRRRLVTTQGVDR